MNRTIRGFTRRKRRSVTSELVMMYLFLLRLYRNHAGATAIPLNQAIGDGQEPNETGRQIIQLVNQLGTNNLTLSTADMRRLMVLRSLSEVDGDKCDLDSVHLLNRIIDTSANCTPGVRRYMIHARREQFTQCKREVDDLLGLALATLAKRGFELRINNLVEFGSFVDRHYENNKQNMSLALAVSNYVKDGARPRPFEVREVEDMMVLIDELCRVTDENIIDTLYQYYEEFLKSDPEAMRSGLEPRRVYFLAGVEACTKILDETSYIIEEAVDIIHEKNKS